MSTIVRHVKVYNPILMLVYKSSPKYVVFVYPLHCNFTVYYIFFPYYLSAVYLANPPILSDYEKANYVER